MNAKELNKITKKKFDQIYNKYQPNWWTRMAFKYFSKSTEKKNMKPANTITGILLTCFAVGMLGTILGWSRAIVGTVTIAYSILLAVLVLSLFAAVFMNNARLKKVAKDLEISIHDYNDLVDKFYPEGVS